MNDQKKRKVKQKKKRRIHLDKQPAPKQQRQGFTCRSQTHNQVRLHCSQLTDSAAWECYAQNVNITVICDCTLGTFVGMWTVKLYTER